MRVPDNAYRYRVDVPIEEYFQDWGRMLGQMHHLAKSYLPKNNLEVRPDWFELHSAKSLYEEQMEESLPTVHSKIQAFWLELQALQRDDNSYGLIHGDFNDGNFTIDYENGDMTVFDFDDCCYFWFAYELGSAWEGGIGRTMFQGLKKRQAFMKHYMEQVLEGYDRENSLSADWLSRLPMFIRLIQIEEFLHFFQYIDDNEDEEGQAELAYRIKCIEDDIPYMGFFDTIYSPAKPFSL
jgi:Ser/Thr protein kinase RdoA (MazF antagonist)